tara:strand:- start:361 stop:480 length:120 start_codon:yes stop_codon:yes gene_type:complete
LYVVEKDKLEDGVTVIDVVAVSVELSPLEEIDIDGDEDI